MKPEELNSLKYADLQKLAKEAGIRANQKVEKLIKALTAYYQDSNEEQTFSEDISKDSTDEDKTTELCEQFTETPVKVKPDETGLTNTQGKKRRRTFELEEATLSGNSTPIIENDQPRSTRLRSSKTPQSEPHQPVKRIRRDTYEKKSPSIQGSPVTAGSPSTKSILDAIDGDCPSAERKEQLLSAIGKKVKAKMASSPSHAIKSQPSQIPRFMAFLTNKKKETQVTKTPGSSNKNWGKIHKKEFEKFDSIDVYLERKNQRKENLSSAKKRLLPQKSPAVRNAAKVVKPVTNDTKIFKPTVRSTKNLNFDFSKPLFETSSKTPSKAKATITPSRRKPPSSTTKTTPFHFTGNTSTLNTTANASNKKPKFDLKASLARPLTWKPHTGRLQSVDLNSTTTAASHNAAAPTRTFSGLGVKSRVRATASRDPSNSRIKQRKANKR